MARIQTDENGRRYVARPDGTRVYVPAPGTVGQRDAAHAAEQINAYHRALRGTIEEQP